MSIKKISKDIKEGIISGDVTIIAEVVKADYDIEYKKRDNSVGYRHAFEFQDITGAISGSSFEDISYEVRDILKVGNVVSVTAKSNVYNDTAQLALGKNLEVFIPEEGSYNPNEIILDLAGPVEELKDRLEAVILDMIDEECIKLIRHIQKKKWFQENFWDHPAAKSMHHAQEKGLALHTISMMEKAAAQIDNNPAIKWNKDVVIASAFIHDLGKIWEMRKDGSYTVNSLIGHITLGYIICYDSYKDGIITSETLTQVGHAVLAHHGKLEWGSPVVPATIEAMKLHLLDMDDANEYAFTKAMLGLEPGEIEGRPTWPNPAIYRPADTSNQIATSLSDIAHDEVTSIEKENGLNEEIETEDNNAAGSFINFKV